MRHPQCGIPACAIGRPDTTKVTQAAEGTDLVVKCSCGLGIIASEGGPHYETFKAMLGSEPLSHKPPNVDLYEEDDDEEEHTEPDLSEGLE